MAFTPNRLIYYGFAAIGAGYVWKLARGDDAEPATMVPSDRQLGYAAGGERNAEGIRSLVQHPVANIDQRVGYIVQQIRKDSEDKDVISEARAIVSGKCPVEDGGRLDWCHQPKDWKGEIAMLYRAVTDPNSKVAMRYTRDHATIDLFGSSSLLRRLPSGDCFVHGTLVLRDDHTLVPVESLKVGDRIWGLDKWTRVEQTWDKGVLPTWLIKLNNGSSMRLTPDHKVWVLVCEKHRTGAGCTQNTCPLAERSKKVVRVHQLTKNMTLLQPDKIDAGPVEMDPEEAWIEGVFAADGWVDSPTRFCIAGKDGHPKEAQKRRVEAFFSARGIKTTWHRRYIYIYSREWVERLSRFGKGAVNKRVSSLAYSAAANKELIEGIMADASTSDHAGRCLTTTSHTLFSQTRILLKTQGVSCSERFVANHGGLGKNPVWRLTERLKKEDKHRGIKVLRVKEVVRDDVELPCFDFATEDKHIWLPEADWTVHNCDDMAIRLGALLRSIGYAVRCRIVAPAGQPRQWAHIYLMVGNEPGTPTPSKWYALDPTEPQHGPFWEVPSSLISTKKDYEV
jgi:hypothetical protein